MSYPEHLRILNQGVNAWNQWRADKPNESPDLSFVNLSGKNLSMANFRSADLGGADFINTNLCNADLSGANLGDANLSGAKLINTDFSNVDLTFVTFKNANLMAADLSAANLSGVDLGHVNLSNANLSGAKLIKTNLESADLSNANLSGTDLSNANLIQAILSGANLINANLSGAEISDANLTAADLSQANLSGANLSCAHLDGADLSGTNFSEANLSLTNLSSGTLNHADLSMALLGGTIFANLDLSEVIGLDAAKHRGPSSIGIDTLYESHGRIPESFLRDAGVPEEIIDLARSIRCGPPIQWHSCFISYSTKDDELARRLHTRMREANMRVWFAPEDLKGGRKLHEQLFDAIQIHDRLLLVLSEDSIRSEWVMTEIRKAREVERQEKRRKLFPVRLMDFDTLRNWTCFDADSGKDLAVEVREYFIPDFSNWKDHDTFEKAFARLQADLKAGA